MGMLVMAPSHTEKVTLRKMGRKDNKEKTPRIGIKHLEKIQPHAAIKSSQGEMIPARNSCFMRDQKVSKDHRASNPENDIPMTG